MSPGPHPGGVEGSGLGGLQAHTGGGGIPACTEADPPPQLTATAAGGTHPNGMHSCYYVKFSVNGKSGRGSNCYLTIILKLYII